MLSLVIIIFIIGYLGIVLEHTISINKSSSALLTGALVWTLVTFIHTDAHVLSEELMHHIGEIAGILFFLMGAMTIVELIDTYDGFDLITDRIKTKNLKKLLWIIGLLAFFLSAILDNLTTTIVMITLIRKIIDKKEMRLLFVGITIIAANAGGAWSPMGDVTTTMLWIGGQISAINIMKQLFLPSLISAAIPLILLTPKMKGNVEAIIRVNDGEVQHTEKAKRIIFFTGIGGLLFVPIFKSITHLPPFMGMILALGVLWFVSEIILKNKEDEFRNQYSIQKALERLDMPSIFFFLGILLAVSGLQTLGILTNIAHWLDTTLQNQTLIVSLIGLFSSIVDNVPLVAAVMAMYPLEQFPTDHPFWELLAYCAGTGGSTLIIGSAAGVAAMGMENIDFFWYFKKISWLALLGYFAGIAVFIFMAI